MKNIACIILICMANLANAQSKVEKVIPVGAGQSIAMEFTWPELITIKTWNKNEIKLVARVDINRGQNDDAFKLVVDQSSSTINIASVIENYKNLPRKIVINKGGQEYFFNTDDHNSPEIIKFKEDYGSANFNYTQYGVIMDITLEIWIPENVSLEVKSKYGMVEVLGFNGDMKIHSKFGGIDVSSSGNQQIKVGTKFGEKYTNLTNSIKSVSVGNHPGKWDWVMIGASNSSGSQELKSEFGNIYIRRL